MKKVSVIIPVYNAMTSGGGHIVKCVNSILEQKGFSLEDIEVLLLNDGSKDNSIEFLKDIETKYPSTVRVFSHKNIGVAKTRNKGIDLAIGEYIMFVDQDDWIDENYISTLCRALEVGGLDVVVSGYRRPDSEGLVRLVSKPSKTKYGPYTIGAAWAKLHRASFLRKHKIKFFDNSYGEDIPFMIAENQNAQDKVGVIDYVGYNWFFNEESVSNTAQSRLTLDNVAAIENLLREITANYKNSKEINYYLLRTTAYYLLMSGQDSTRDEFMYAQKRLFSILRKYEGFSIGYVSTHPPKGEHVRVVVIVGLFVALSKLKLMNLFAFFWCRRRGVSTTS